MVTLTILIMRITITSSLITPTQATVNCNNSNSLLKLDLTSFKSSTLPLFHWERLPGNIPNSHKNDLRQHPNIFNKPHNNHAENQRNSAHCAPGKFECWYQIILIIDYSSKPQSDANSSHASLTPNTLNDFHNHNANMFTTV